MRPYTGANSHRACCQAPTHRGKFSPGLSPCAHTPGQILTGRVAIRPYTDWVQCRHFGLCGGCASQDVPYAAQLERKRQAVSALLQSALGEETFRIEPTIGVPTDCDGQPWHFRHKSAFVFARDPQSRRGFVMGHHTTSGNQVFNAEECPVQSARANRLAFALRSHLASTPLTAAGPRLDGLLRHVLIRTTHDDREAIVMLVVTRNDKRLRAPLRAFLSSPERPDGLFVNINDRPGPYMVGPTTIRIAGKSHVREEILGMKFLVSPTAFFQTNLVAAETLLREVLCRVKGVDTSASVLDLYAGSGLFALPLAARGHAVTAIEENAQAVRDAEANQRLNRMPPSRLRVVRGRVEEVLKRVVRDRFGAAVVDPPRQGCPPGVLRALFSGLSPERVIYVSCNPEALARELPAAIDAGYRIEHVQPVDMFPHTPHIEAVVTLGRRSPTSSPG
jgi:23S rRNA (uracil1939-C5)-methyltransferase